MDNAIELSKMQMAKGQTSNRNAVEDSLTRHPNYLNISVSVDGGQSREGIMTCGIAYNDTTQHFLWVVTCDIEEECPFEPHKVKMPEAIALCIVALRAKKVIVAPHNYECFTVTALQQDTKREGAKHAVYRAIVEVPDMNHSFFCCPPKDINPRKRMLHIVFLKKQELLADLGNKRGSNPAVNMSTVCDATNKLKRFINLNYPGNKSDLPNWLKVFEFQDVDSMVTFVDALHDMAVKQRDLLNTTPGTTLLHYCYLLYYLIVT